MLKTEKAIVAFPQRAGHPSERGTVVVYTPGGRLAELLQSGLAHPPRMGMYGIVVWEGVAWKADDEGAPPDTEPWRNGLLWVGGWRHLNDDEWVALREKKWL
jgi:hypothetical protein